MSTIELLILALFLPLFPFSMVFNLLFQRLARPLPRAALLVAWPLLGLWLVDVLGSEVPDWVIPWALGTAVFYALRALAVREVGIWTGFIATSAWALLWLPLLAGADDFVLRYDALGLSAPLLLLALLAATLQSRFGAAYTGLYGGLGSMMPRFAAVLAAVVLAIMASPLFPGFFTLLGTIVGASLGVAVAVAGVWLLWSWAGARLIHGLIVGPPGDEPVTDLDVGATWGYALALTALVIVGVSLTGGLL